MPGQVARILLPAFPRQSQSKGPPMRAALCSLMLPLSCLLALAAPVAPAAADQPTSAWVYPGPGGKLVYKTTPAGDRILDFSHAGYMGGGVAIPRVPVKKTVSPTRGEDDSAAIQKAIDELAAMPL